MNKTPMLSFQLAVPVNFSVVELENTIIFARLDTEVIIARQDLVRKGAELRLCTDVCNLIDNGAHTRALVNQHLGDQLLVGQKLIPQV
ncbi:hypothetical protein RRF57_000379 [Xylaria bambusicola]|uniref:Uncharacterized protein n=1 Tax=Xylaria bambusicola TaxID=326684 RepID=A0AAN7UAL0_9PEZI